MNYKKKYEKYRRKYIELKNSHDKDNNDNSDEYKREYFEIDMYLFFDLLQVSMDIINMTTKDDFLILIGDTPSYLKPFLEGERKVFNLPSSGKPFGCFIPPYGEPWKLPVSLVDFFRPNVEKQSNYFNYLDKKTILTKKFVTNNWKNIVLIDTSSGQSIMGASIFFNRYIGNIDIKKDCINIKNAKPLKFIELAEWTGYTTNIEPESAKEIFVVDKGREIRNYNPKLIILCGNAIFLYGPLWKLHEKYPRYVPTYSTYSWDKEPYDTDENLEEGLKNIKQLTKLVDLYFSYTNNNKKARQLLNFIRKMPKLQKTEQKLLDKINIDDKNLIEKIKNFFIKINERLIIAKYNLYIENKNDRSFLPEIEY